MFVNRKITEFRDALLEVLSAKFCHRIGQNKIGYIGKSYVSD